ncbi:MAG: DEAD/DEAH box helicase family protein [Roseiflexaceae bacterium]
MSHVLMNEFYCEYNLTQARAHPSKRSPASHQSDALAKLNPWFAKPSKEPKGGILVLPTGGGKTFTATRFLCTGPLSQGYRVLWLAHTHHLLEQALASLGQEVGHIGGSKPKLCVRVVSGTKGHCKVHEIKTGDDVVIATLQTITQAYRVEHPHLKAFLRAAGDKLCVVFDEAHHSPAYSYRTLITNLRKQHPNMLLLGLTATPTYTDEQKRGWLKTLFPQGILHQSRSQELIASGILSRPIFEDHRTSVSMEFDESQFRTWQNTNRDIPEEIITQLAENHERNLLIAETYIKHKDRYGKTIMFADRWFQCEQICTFLKNRGVKADTIYTRIDADRSSPEERNRRTADENKRVLEAFRNNKLDVLLNVRMLTEGTDVPNVNTVFLTRQTTSSILLTQMIGRALRGPKFGGTENAYIVSFIDNWRHLINWADYSQLAEGVADDGKPAYTNRLPLQYISIDLIRRLSVQMDSGVNINTQPFLSLLPIGWYLVDFDALVEGTDDQEVIHHMIMVFDVEQASYQRFISAIKNTDLSAFEAPDTFMNQHVDQIETWYQQFFADQKDRSVHDIKTNIFHLVRHIAQRRIEPAFFSFEERGHHDLDAIARKFIQDNLGTNSEYEALQVEYSRPDRYWSTFYTNYERFWSHYQACKGNILFKHHTTTIEPERPEFAPLREPSSELKDQVKARDGYKCLSCGETNKRILQVDHVAPSYLGGNNSLQNLQTLCKHCNRHKSGINEINFRNQHTLLSKPPSIFPEFDMPDGSLAGEPIEWDKFLRRSINFFYRCSAVDVVFIGKRGQYFHQWHIILYAGNDPQWLRSHGTNLLQQIQSQRSRAGRQGPRSIIISAPDMTLVECKLDT